MSAVSTLRIDVVTIFPEYLEPLSVSLLGKARERRRAGRRHSEELQTDFRQPRRVAEHADRRLVHDFDHHVPRVHAQFGQAALDCFVYGVRRHLD